MIVSVRKSIPVLSFGFRTLFLGPQEFCLAVCSLTFLPTACELMFVSDMESGHRSRDCQSCPDSWGKPGEPQKDSYFKSDTKLRPLYTRLKQNKKREKGGAGPSHRTGPCAFLAECQKENTWLYGK